ncbi:hypothetical protein KPH14_011378 [Odynerus spinipes]|uniref:Proclotting enzyme n=1 Tax=Odynerus spinipes TaxID=1348599 RepID=A0AAD9RJG3_9HYME|nr:hypothetical protein KPH14_011378 [Odynerus spinipes]
MFSSSLISLYIVWNIFGGAFSYTEDIVHYRGQPLGYRIPQYSLPARGWPPSSEPWNSGIRRTGNQLLYRRDTQLRPPRVHLVKIEEEQSDPLATISETLGALNTVGSYIVNMTRGVETSNSPPKELPSALYTISKNILGLNVTDSIAPLVRRGVSLTSKPSSKLQTTTTTTTTIALAPVAIFTTPATPSGPVSQALSQQTSIELTNRDRESVLPTCITADGSPGKCQDLSNCPQLLLDLKKLRQSLCFKSILVPGVCCPTNKEDLSDASGTITSTVSPVIQNTVRPTRPPYRPVKPPTPRPIPLFPVDSATSESPSGTILIPDVSSNNTNNVDSIGTIDNNYIQDDEECGVRNSGKYRVVGGEEALPGRWPWMAAIFLHGSKRTEFWCGGSLIGPRHVLTAAHCTRDQRQRPFATRQFTVRLGDIDLERDDEPSSPETYTVKAIHAHPKFSRVGFYNDIAVLELNRPVKKSPYVIPICLPQGRFRGEAFAGARPTVVGWGTTYYGGKESTVQRQAVLPVWRNEDCNAAYFQPITSNFLCAGYSQGGKDACQGDSGGPLMLRAEGRWMQIGIVSFGNKCGEPGYPGVYTRVTQYLDWIKGNIK